MSAVSHGGERRQVAPAKIVRRPPLHSRRARLRRQRWEASTACPDLWPIACIDGCKRPDFRCGVGDAYATSLAGAFFCTSCKITSSAFFVYDYERAARTAERARTAD